MEIYQKNIIDYQLSTKQSFIEYSNDIGMNISSMREVHYVLLFHLCFLCLVGDLTDSEKLKDKLTRLFNRLKNMLYKK